MVDPEIEFLASVAGQDVVDVNEAKAWFRDANRARKALHHLQSERLIFPVARGAYVMPPADLLATVLSLRWRQQRLAAWLPGRLQQGPGEAPLAGGLDWHDARVVDLAVDRYTRLVWPGPELLVPISEGATHLRGLHNRVPVLAYDPVDDAVPIAFADGLEAPGPSPRDLARVLSVHNDPRLREAAAEVADGLDDPAALNVFVARTDPPMPFPDGKTALPLGPSFRYRLFAPRSWVKRNIRHVWRVRHGGDGRVWPP